MFFIGIATRGDGIELVLINKPKGSKHRFLRALSEPDRRSVQPGKAPRYAEEFSTAETAERAVREHLTELAQALEAIGGQLPDYTVGHKKVS